MTITNAEYSYGYGPKLNPDQASIQRGENISVFAYYPAYMGPKRNREVFLLHRNFPTREKSQALRENWRNNGTARELFRNFLIIKSHYPGKPDLLIDDIGLDENKDVVTDVLVKTG